MSMDIKIEFNESMLASLMRIPVILRLEPSERILKAMAKPVVAKAKDIAPSSRASGTRKTWSAKLKANDSYQIDSGRHIGVKYLKNNIGGVLIVGGVHPKANKLNFEAGKKRIVKVWGRDPKSIPIVKRIDPRQRFMQRAYDETLNAQLAAGQSQLVKEIKELEIG